MKLIEVGLMLENNGVESSPYNDYMIELILEACEKEAQEKVNLLAEALLGMLIKDGVIKQGSGATPPELLVAAKDYKGYKEKVKEIFKEIDVQMPKKHYEDEGFHHAPKECKLCWYLALKQKYLNEEGKQKLTTKEFLALPIVKRRKLLQEQANDPEIILYYLHILWDEMAMQDKGMMD